MSPSVKLKKRIRAKFKSVSRFSRISGLPYMSIHDSLRRGTEKQLSKIEAVLDRTDNKYLDDEVSSAQIAAVKKALEGKKVNVFCKEIGIWPSWLVLFLKGKVRFRSEKVERLFNALNIQ